MKKLPHIPFYTGDWLKDPKLSVCTPATRGVWMDLLCAMHEQDRLGELRGTTEQLARLARCSTVELEAALTELQTTDAAVVQSRNGSYTIANRRMKREADTRLKRAEAGSKGGSQTQAGREQKPDNDNDIDCLRVITEFCTGLGLPGTDAEAVFAKWQGNGWTNRGEPIRDWKATIRSWKLQGYMPSQRHQQHGNGSNGHAQHESVWALQNRIDAATKELLQIKNSPANRIVDPSNIRPPLKPEFKKRVAELTENIETWKKKITTTNP